MHLRTSENTLDLFGCHGNSAVNARGLLKEILKCALCQLSVFALSIPCRRRCSSHFAESSAQRHGVAGVFLRVSKRRKPIQISF